MKPFSYTPIPKISLVKDYEAFDALIILFNEWPTVGEFGLNKEELRYLKDTIGNKGWVSVLKDLKWMYFVQKPASDDDYEKAEQLRQMGCQIYDAIKPTASSKIVIENRTPTAANALDFVEGWVLTHYHFDWYKSKKDPVWKHTLDLCDSSVSTLLLKDCLATLTATYMCRDLVNVPANYLTVQRFGEEAEALSKMYGLDCEVLGVKQIEALQMGGLLGVNRGSKQDPAFVILEYKPKKAINDRPVVLVGKGVVYDTGGYSLKPADSMEWMKCDMAGAAVVLATLCALAELKSNRHIVGLIPLTDNRLDGEAMVPGDVISLSNGTTVEVLNTDAEGRLILADALIYASKYKPELVLDLATLTGSAMRALGSEGAVYMSTASQDLNQKLEHCGYKVHERLVRFPLWKEYGSQLTSRIADLKNIGGDTAGAITAGKFLEHFTSYPWMHLDIAGVVWSKKKESYRSQEATGVGVRLMMQFLKSIQH